MGLKKYNITQNRQFFSILQTSERTQTAMMTLKPGEASGPLENDHPQSEQVVLLLEGRLLAEVGDERSSLEAGDVVTIPAKVAHRLTNDGDIPAVTFNVYGPPAY
ncbi:MAG: cupin domain-containing protein [Candidatus Eremiobacteraeota bacterium]|nr:cupin domain-containing protein [Candidatus Eremiobacteraeota bacterium]